MLVDPTGLVSLGSATNGFGSVNLPIPDVSQFVGALLFAQWAVLDPAAAPGVALTNGLEVLLGN